MADDSRNKPPRPVPTLPPPPGGASKKTKPPQIATPPDPAEPSEDGSTVRREAPKAKGARKPTPPIPGSDSEELDEIELDELEDVELLDAEEITGEELGPKLKPQVQAPRPLKPAGNHATSSKPKPARPNKPAAPGNKVAPGNKTVTLPKPAAATPGRSLPVPGQRPPQPVRGPSTPSTADRTVFAGSVEDDIVSLCQSELRGRPDPTRRARLHFELARVFDEHLGKRDEAVVEYQKALKLSPEHVPSLRALRRLLDPKGEMPMILSLLDREIETEPKPSRKALLAVMRGRLLQEHRSDLNAARESYAKAVEYNPAGIIGLRALAAAHELAADHKALDATLERLADAVQHDPAYKAVVLTARARVAETRLDKPQAAVELLQGALAHDPSCHGALEGLKRLLHAQSRWRELVAVLEQEAEQTPVPQLRAMALHQAATIQEKHLGNRSAAVSKLNEAAQATPNDPLLFEELARLHQLGGDKKALAGVLGRLVDVIDDQETKLVLLHRLGLLYERELESDERARRCYEAALALEPTYIPALRALGGLLAGMERWADLVRMHEREAEATIATPRRAEAHARIADLLESRIGDTKAALPHYELALGLAWSEPVFKALTRLYSANRRHRDLVELYERAIDRASSDDLRFAYLFRVGALYEDVLADPATAVGVYGRILAIDPEHLGALHAQQRSARAANRWEELVAALETEATLAKGTPREVELRHYIGQILDDELSDHETAQRRFQEVMELDPSFGPVFASLGRLLARRGRWDALYKVYERELPLHSDEPPKCVELLYKMGELSEHKLGNERQAIADYRRAIDINAKHLPSLQALSHLLGRRAEYDDLSQVLHAELTATQDPQTRARIAFRLGETYELHLSKPDDALEAYRESLKADAGYRPALDGLARVSVKLSGWRDLAEHLELDAARVADPNLSVGERIQAAILWRDRVGMADRATTAYETIRGGDPLHLGALIGLAPLYRKAEKWAELAQVVAAEARATKDQGVRVGALDELAEITGKHGLADDAELRVVLEQVVTLDPTQVAALETLEGLALSTGDRALLAAVDTRLAAVEDDAAAQSAYRTRLGRSLEREHPEQALEAYRMALAEESDNLSAIRGLRRLSIDRNDAAGLADACRREASWTSSARRAADLLVDSARVLLGRGNDAKGGLEDLERALERCPEHVDASDLLLEQLLEQGQTERLIDVLSRAAEGCGEDNKERGAELWGQVAVLHADAHQNVAAGIAVLERLLKRDPSHVASMTVLAELYERQEQFEEAVEMLDAAIAQGPRREQLVDLHLQLGRIASRELDDQERAVASLSALLRNDSNHVEALTLLMEAHTRAGDERSAADAARRLLRAAGTNEERAAALVEVGRLSLQIGEVDKALEALREAVVLEGPHGRGADLYVPLLGEKEPWGKYAEALSQHTRRVEAGAVQDEDLAATFLELARVQHESLAAPQDAFMTLGVGMQTLDDPPELMLDLGQRLAAAGDHAKAIEELSRLTAMYPAIARGWRSLSLALEQAGNARYAALALGPLAVLGEANDEELAKLRQSQLRPGLAQPDSFRGEVLFSISAGPVVERKIADLLRALDEPVSRLFPPDLEAYGLTAKDKISDKALDHPIRKLVDRLAPIFGIERFDVYMHAGKPLDVIVELTRPVSLMVPAYVRKLPEAEQVFLLARAMSLVAMDLHTARRLGSNRTGMLLAAAARMAKPSYGRGQFDEARLEDWNRKLVKATPWRGKKAVEEAAAAFAALPRLDIAAWVDSLECTATRAGSVLAGDLVGCVEVLVRTDPHRGHKSPGEMVEEPVIADLFRFWASQSGYDFRGRSGLI